MKDFDSWNKNKKIIDEKNIIIGVHEREIWWISLGLNVGIEIDGKHEEFKRPVLIIKKFNKDMVWILPITSKIKSPIFYAKFFINETSYFAALTQIKTVSTKRFIRKIAVISKDDFIRIKSKVVRFLINEDPL